MKMPHCDVTAGDVVLTQQSFGDFIYTYMFCSDEP